MAPLRRGSKIHDQLFQSLKDVGANYVRYVPWLPYPKLGVAELEPPGSGKTSWDFSLGRGVCIPRVYGRGESERLVPGHLWRRSVLGHATDEHALRRDAVFPRSRRRRGRSCKLGRQVFRTRLAVAKELLGVRGSRERPRDGPGMTRRMTELGPEVIQQFDQTPGPAACYSKKHGHPPVPGPWMTDWFSELVHADAGVARTINRRAVMSCEGAPPETYLQDFQTWDARALMCPLYSFLYHEYANGFEGFYTNRISDESQRASVARALVTGYMIEYTLRDKGQIHYDWDQPWTRAVPDRAAALDWANRANHLRAGVAHDFLIYGRMLRPGKVSGVSERDFGWGEEPAVESGTWQAADGRIGVVLAYYANLRESPRVELEGQVSKRLPST